MLQINSKTLLVDADGLVYRCGFAADKKKYVARSDAGTVAEFTSKRELDKWIKEYMDSTEGKEELEVDYLLIPEPLSFALQNVSTVIDALSDRFPDCSMEFYIGGEDNFRNKLATILPYKGNRSEFAKPTHYADIRSYLVKRYNAQKVDGQETDDMLGIRATELGDSCVIVTTDKDLDTIPGWHFNWVKKDLYYVKEADSYRAFYSQLLTGDDTDNIPGLEGVGPKTAAKILKGFNSPRGMWQAVLAEYATRCPDGFMGRGIKEALLELGNLLYIRKHPDEKWETP